MSIGNFLDNFFYFTPVPVAILNIKEHVFFVLLVFEFESSFESSSAMVETSSSSGFPMNSDVKPQLQQLDLAKGSETILHVSPQVWSEKN